MVNSRLIIFFFILLPALDCAAENVIAPYPGAQLVSESTDKEIKSHQIISGPVKRVNTKLAPDASEFVSATKSTRIFEIPDQRSTKPIAEYYREALLRHNQILFECSGRTCGASNFWANSVFNRSILYGPEQYQYYFLAKHLSDETFTVIYVAQRATGKLYAYLETLKTESGKMIGGKEIASSIRTEGKYVFEGDMDEVVLTAFYEAINASADIKYMLVSHDKLQRGEAVEAAISRTLQMAQSLKNALVAKGIQPTRLETFGAGPIAPLDRDRVKRFELVEVLN